MRPTPLLTSPRSYGNLRFYGRPDDVLAQLRAIIRKEESTHRRVIGSAFAIHPEVAERMERVNG